MQWMLRGVDGRPSQFVRWTTSGRRDVVSPVLTVGEVCRRFKRSRRQVYRYIRSGRLQPCGRVLGQWLFSPEDVTREQVAVPRWLQPFFWDVRVSQLSVRRHASFMLARLLESGDRKAIRWVFHTYGRRELVEFLKGRGAAVLSARAWQFWAALLALGPKRRRPLSWRRQGRLWGGVR